MVERHYAVAPCLSIYPPVRPSVTS